MQTEKDTYQLTEDEEGNQIFINPDAALEQMILDSHEGAMDDKIIQYLEILIRSL